MERSVRRPRSRQSQLLRARQAERLVWLRTSTAAAVGIGLVGLPMLLYGVTRGSSRFALHEVKVQGLRSVPSHEILTRVRLEAQADLLGVDLEEIRRAVARHAWVKEVRARKVYPDRLILTIVERVPVATVEAANGLQLVAEDGVILGPALGRDLHRPLMLGVVDSGVVTGGAGRLEPGDRVSAEGFGAVVEVLRLLASEAPTSPDSRGAFSDLRVVDLGPGDQAVMQFRDLRVRFSRARLVTEWQRLLAVRADIERRAFRGEIDLRFPGRVVVRPQKAV